MNTDAALLLVAGIASGDLLKRELCCLNVWDGSYRYDGQKRRHEMEFTANAGEKDRHKS